MKLFFVVRLEYFPIVEKKVKIIAICIKGVVIMICEVKDFKDIYLWYPGAEFVQKIQETRSNCTELFILRQYNIDHRY